MQFFKLSLSQICVLFRPAFITKPQFVMKRILYVFALLVTVLFNACDKSDIEYENNLERSRDAWLDFKKASNNSYRYVVTSGSWAGSSWRTMITVENGEVTRRDFQYNEFNGVPMPEGGWSKEKILEMLDLAGLTAAEYREQTGQELEEILEWTEENHEVGLRQSTSAALPLTLDEVYDKAQNDWLRKRSDAKTYLETDNGGMISSCGYVIDRCQDDCFVGINISMIEAL